MSHTFTVALVLLTTCIFSVRMFEWRLPKLLLPSKYKISLEVPKNSMQGWYDNEYSGTVKIDVIPIQLIKSVKLHTSVSFQIHLITIDDLEVNGSYYEVQPLTEILTILTPHEIPINQTFTITIKFSGLISTLNYGIYKSSAGSGKVILATHFEPVHARKAFPCFDEPTYKSIFEIDITYPTGYNALSNTPGTVVVNDNGTETAQFVPTPVMPVYLVAFVISDFTCSEGKSIGSTRYRVCSNSNFENSRRVSLEAGPSLIKFFNDYTQYDFSKSVPKLDNVAVEKFPAYGMENWGLILYSETILLWDPLLNTDSQKYLTIRTISHEIAHHWFGNLVTCDWWRDIFLNEGFARFYEFFGPHRVYPNQGYYNMFIQEILQGSLDAEHRGMPLLVSDAESLDEVQYRFTMYLYEKGASMVNMLRYMMGPAIFDKAIPTYLQEFAYKTATVQDLWNVLEKSMDPLITKLPAKSLSEVMHNWMHEHYYPLLIVEVDYFYLDFTITQKVFSPEKSLQTRWYVPICYTTSDGTEKFTCNGPDLWLTPDKPLKIKLNKKPEWFLINNQMGYFAVDYGDVGWKIIKEALRKPDYAGISEINRAIIVNDLFRLLTLKTLPYSKMLDIIGFLKNETAFYPWQSATRNFKSMFNVIDIESPSGALLREYFLDLMDNVYRTVSFSTTARMDEPTSSRKQALILQIACSLKRPDCVSISQELFDKFKDEGIRIDPNIEEVILCTAAKHSSTAWGVIWDMYRSASTNISKTVIISTLGCTNDKQLLRRYLEASTEKSLIANPGNRPEIFAAVCRGSPNGVAVAIDFLKSKKDNISQMFSSVNDFHNVLFEISTQCVTEKQLDEIEELFSEPEFRGPLKLLKDDVVKGRRRNIRQLTKNQEAIVTYLKNVKGQAEEVFQFRRSIVFMLSLVCYYL